MNVKWTDKNSQTYGGMQWGEGITHKLTHKGAGTGRLCTINWLHYYQDELLAVLMNSIHAHYNEQFGQMWEITARGIISVEPDKCGCTELTMLREIEKPIVTTEQRIWFGILCAQAVRHLVNDPWMEKWDMWVSNRLEDDKLIAATVYAASAAAYAIYANNDIDLVAIAHKAVEAKNESAH